jgi:hypothetical protein
MKKAPIAPVLCLLLAACGGASQDDVASEQAAEAEPAAGTQVVHIVTPSEGEVFEEGEFTVILESTVPIVPAGDMTPGTGHHHLYLDEDVGDLSVPVPTVEGRVVHMGDASSAFTFEGVSSGPHRLIAVVADGAHVPIQPLVVDTVYFVVE